ncbi:MAG: protein-L-isoaspartate O-methyltransferase family protein [Alphaproteobacteria bacterium]|jgi:protein-L-isoaspartate(D-aspartate) O-methyltransferase|nr:methyltransferase domain-containing protein [Candidatus Jidaibacter sp.]
MDTYFEQARINMVKNQVMPNNVTNEHILNVMLNTPKHMFVTHEWESVCYFEGRVPVAQNREILSAQTIGKMLQALNIKGTESVLEIACGTGYTTSLLSQLCQHVVAIENIHDIAVKAAHNITALNLKNVAIKQSELASGALEGAPYDIIFVNGVLNQITNTLLSQLAENGKIISLKRSGKLCTAVLLIKSNNSLNETELFTAYGPDL